MTKRALVSVYDKSGIVDFVSALQTYGVDVLSTGGTLKLLSSHDITVTAVSEYTEFPEIFGGRVKTLHPKLFGGILGNDEPLPAGAPDCPAIHFVIVNLYPFEQVSAQPGTSLSQAIEHIDIGGSALLRSAAKNYARVTVITDTQDYDRVLALLAQHNGMLPIETRFELAKKAFRLSASYDAAIAAYFEQQSTQSSDAAFPEKLNLSLYKQLDLSRGENPHQAAALYRFSPQQTALPRQHHGKPLSFNNIVDTEVAWGTIATVEKPACAIIKHATPCAVAQANTILEAYKCTYQADPTSAFGSVLALNRAIDQTVLKQILEQHFIEVIIAPAFTDDALKFSAEHFPRVRVLTQNPASQQQQFDIKPLQNGCLLQEPASQPTMTLKTVTERTPTADEQADLLFAWHVVSMVKSNAIVCVAQGKTLGIGAGQTSRIRSMTLALASLNTESPASVIASDGFFPFRDNIDRAAQAGVTALIQPGGSVRDAEVIAAANEHGMAMLLTGIRQFRH